MTIVWHRHPVQPEQRYALLKQRPLTIWMTGLSAAGKSTIAGLTERILIESGHAAYVLDGDNVRHGLNKDLGFTAADRHENIRRIAEVARLMNEAGLIVLTAFISPYRADRQQARDIIGPERFFEVYVATPLDVCESRDPKGLYRKARSGEITDFTGVSAPYEPPEQPALVLTPQEYAAETSAQQLIAALRSKISWLSGSG